MRYLQLFRSCYKNTKKWHNEKASFLGNWSSMTICSFCTNLFTLLYKIVQYKKTFYHVNFKCHLCRKVNTCRLFKWTGIYLFYFPIKHFAGNFEVIETLDWKFTTKLIFQPIWIKLNRSISSDIDFYKACHWTTPTLSLSPDAAVSLSKCNYCTKLFITIFMSNISATCPSNTFLVFNTFKVTLNLFVLAKVFLFIYLKHKRSLQSLSNQYDLSCFLPPASLLVLTPLCQHMQCQFCFSSFILFPSRSCLFPYFPLNSYL